jgi:hypothetical protein
MLKPILVDLGLLKHSAKEPMLLLPDECPTLPLSLVPHIGGMIGSGLTWINWQIPS